MTEKKPHKGGKRPHTQQYKISNLEFLKTIIKTSSILQSVLL
jgi:hypothetical protein